MTKVAEVPQVEATAVAVAVLDEKRPDESGSPEYPAFFLYESFSITLWAISP